MSSQFDLTGRTALVTGAARGLGFAYAKGLAAAGAEVVLNDLREVNVAEAADKLRAQGYKARGMAFDITDESAVAKAFATLDQEGVEIDILINNAGIQFRKPLLELEPAISIPGKGVASALLSACASQKVERIA